MQFKEFDAFPKVESGFVKRTGSGGILTLVVSAILCILVMGEIKDYMTLRNDYNFIVDPLVNHQLQINLDITIAMPCDGKKIYPAHRPNQHTEACESVAHSRVLSKSLIVASIDIYQR